MKQTSHEIGVPRVLQRARRRARGVQAPIDGYGPRIDVIFRNDRNS